MGVVVENINVIGAVDSSFLYEGKEFSFSLKNFPSEKVETAKYKQYDNTDLISALNDLATIYDCEWWVEGNVIYFGKCELDGDEVEFEIDNNVSDMSQTESDKEYATRIYAFGSERNIPSDYRKDSGADVTKNGVVQKRLMLPTSTCPKGYIQDEGVSNESEAIEAVYVDEDIYPRVKCVVGSIETYTSTATDEDTGELIKTTYYRLHDSSGFNFSTSYILEGEALHILFQSGKMNGMDFECTYSDSEKYYEVVANEDYGRQLPDTDLHPEVSDEFVIYGWDSTKIGDTGLIDAAEKELYEAALEKIADLKIDPRTYTCKMMSDVYEKNMLTPDGGYYQYDLGQKVKLINKAYFESGRSSRVIGFDIKLDYAYDEPEYIIGEATEYSKTESLQKQIDSITYNGNSYQNGTGSGSGIYVITSTSPTPSSDSNVYSAKRSDRQFLRKNEDDTAKGKITFEKGMQAIAESFLDGGAQFGTFVKSLFAGTGAGIDKNGNAEFESVRVRSAFEVLELIVNRLSAIEGDQLLTESDTIESVDDLGGGCYGLHLRSKWDGYFTAQSANNVLKGIVNTLSAGSGTYYTAWFRVNSVNTANNYIEVTQYADADTPAGKNYPPTAMMRIARWGNQTDTSRQSCIYMSSTEGRIVKLTCVTKPILDKSNYGVSIGTPLDFLKSLSLPLREGRDYMYAAGVITTDLIRIDYQGAPIPEFVDRGIWSSEESYYHNTLNTSTGVYETSDVWYNGCKYRCQKTGTATKPAWNNTDWAMVEGNPDFSVDFEESDNIFDPDNFNATLTIVARLYNADITSDILDADVQWTRYSEDASGTERTESDNAWDLRRSNSGKSISLTIEDCDINGDMPKTLRFTATVTLRDVDGNAVSEQSVSYEY